jgi:hypothetical protein
MELEGGGLCVGSYMLHKRIPEHLLQKMLRKQKGREGRDRTFILANTAPQVIATAGIRAQVRIE